MNTIFITNQFKTGGVERVFLNIAANITDKKVFLLPIHQNFDEDFIKQIPQNVKIITNSDYPIDSVTSFFNIFRLANFVNKMFKDRDDLCCINFSDTITTIIVSILIKAKIHISWCHCNPNAYRNSNFFFLYKKFFKKFDNVVCICRTQKEEFCKVFGNFFENKIRLCCNLTDLKKIDSVKNESLEYNKDFILMVARFDNRSKDFYTLIDAYKKLDLNLKGKYNLVLVGGGDDIELIKKYAEESGECQNIYFAGLQGNPYKWMNRAKIFVLSSKTEGFPLVICEALSCGCPVISSNCVSGPSDILENGKYGLLYEVGDSITLANEIQNMLSNVELYNGFKNQSRKRVEDINNEALISINDIFSGR